MLPPLIILYPQISVDLNAPPPHQKRFLQQQMETVKEIHGWSNAEKNQLWSVQPQLLHYSIVPTSSAQEILQKRSGKTVRARGPGRPLRGCVA